MKTLIIFIGLKISEIAGLSIIAYLIALMGKWAHYWKYDDGLYRLDTMLGFTEAFFFGLGVLVFFALVLIVVGALCVIIYKNWKWAKRLGRGKT